MGIFSEIASEARRGMAAPARQTNAAPPPPAAPKPAPALSVAAPAAQPEPAPEATAPVPAEATQEPVPVPEPPAINLTPEADAANEAKRKQAHEAAEAKRKAEWDAKQAEKHAAEQTALDKLAAMSDADAVSEAAKRVCSDTEKITRRNMKELVAAHVQALCQTDPVFARKTMHPRKSIVNCFRYISRKAYEYIQDELKADGIKPGPGSEGYGCDVPDDLCFQWAGDYFNDPDAVEDKTVEEKFVPRPYTPSTQTQSSARKKQAADKKPPKPKTKADAGQITLGGFAPTEVKAE